MSQNIADPGVAVITGGAQGIGLAVAEQCVQRGYTVVLLDQDDELLRDKLHDLGDKYPGKAISGYGVDVRDLTRLQEIESTVRKQFGDITFLMNNAGVAIPTGKPWENPQAWRDQIDVNYWGVVNSVHAFVPGMIESGQKCTVVNTGSKQGLTNPPPRFAYNVSKSAVISYTQGLAHALREEGEGKVTAALLVPGFTYTGMISRFVPKKPPAAWVPDQVAEFLFDGLDEGRFYIICPDNDVTESMDNARIAWHAKEKIEKLPALSRWHKDYQAEFKRHMDESAP